jgi:hypothetical protein
VNPHYEQTAAQLRFYYRDAPGALGLKSNFGAMISSLEGGGWTPRPTHEVPEHRLEAAHRTRHIHSVLELVPVWARCVLGVTFRYHDGAELMLCATLLAVDYHRRSKTKRTIGDWVERCRKSKDPKRNRLWLELRQNADAIIEEALDEYERVAAVLNRRAAEVRASRSAG